MQSFTIPVPELTSEDITNNCEFGQRTLKDTDVVCSSTSLEDMHVHQTALEKAENGIEQVMNVLERFIGQTKNSYGALESMKKDIKRHSARTTRSYWLLKNSLPKL